jgi:antagonist of KipI
MTSLIVQSPGLLTTIQDLGRPGFGPLGVSPSGAADAVALRLANLLVANKPGAAALEITLVGGSFVFPRGAVIALTGADFGATIDGSPVELWRTYKILPGAKLALGPARDFARGYLAVSGGLRVPPFLGSASTHLLSGLGGYEGRALRKGDVLSIHKPARKFQERKISQSALSFLRPREVLRATEAPQAHLFSENDQQQFFCNTFRVSESSDRTGVRLEGHPLQSTRPAEMITEGVPLGAVQVPPSGQPIILGVEQQTTGGYPKIANVIGVDLHRVGQLRPRAQISFERTSLAVARSLWIEQERLLNNPRQLFA